MAADATLLYLSTRKLEVEPGAGVLPIWRRALNLLSWIEPSVSVGPVGLSVRVPRQQVSDLQRVSYFWKRLKKNGQVGTIDEPKEWIEGSHRVRYQTFSSLIRRTYGSAVKPSGHNSTWAVRSSPSTLRRRPLCRPTRPCAFLRAT